MVLTREYTFEITTESGLQIEAYLRRSAAPHPLLPMIKTCELEPTVCEGESGWKRRRRVFTSSSDLPPWLARIVGGALVHVREDARWPPSLAELQLYSCNLSHRGLLVVEEWATFEPSATPGFTTKRLIVRVEVVPLALRVLSGRLERYLQARYLHSIALGEKTDEVLRKQILEERLSTPADGEASPADAPPPSALPVAPLSTLELGTPMPPPPPLPPPPPPCPPSRALKPSPLSAHPFLGDNQPKKLKVLPMLLGLAKWGALAVVCHNSAVVVLARR